MRLPTTRRLVLRFLPPVPWRIGRSFMPNNRLLRKNPLKSFGRRFGLSSFTRGHLVPRLFETCLP